MGGCFERLFACYWHEKQKVKTHKISKVRPQKCSTVFKSGDKMANSVDPANGAELDNYFG